MTRNGSALTIDDGEHALDPTTERTIEDLREVITALDRRVPRAERTSELDIARDAAVLRAKALARIAELKKGPQPLRLLFRRTASVCRVR